jgi:hypothetical protein
MTSVSFQCIELGKKGLDFPPTLARWANASGRRHESMG